MKFEITPDEDVSKVYDHFRGVAKDLSDTGAFPDGVILSALLCFVINSAVRLVGLDEAEELFRDSAQKIATHRAAKAN